MGDAYLTFLSISSSKSNFLSRTRIMPCFGGGDASHQRSSGGLGLFLITSVLSCGWSSFRRGNDTASLELAYAEALARLHMEIFACFLVCLAREGLTEACLIVCDSYASPMYTGGGYCGGRLTYSVHHYFV